MKHSSTNPILIIGLTIILGMLFTNPLLSAPGDTLFVGSSYGVPGQGGYTIDFRLKNVTTIKGFMFTFFDIPDSLEVTLVERHSPLAGFYVNRNTVDGALKLMVIPEHPAIPLIPPGNRNILRFTVSVAANTPGGENASLVVGDAVFVDDTNSPVSMAVVGGNFWFGKKGDAVYNGIIDLFDVLFMIDVAIGRIQSPTVYQFWASDMNNNGIVDVIDIGMAIDSAVVNPMFSAGQLNQTEIAGSVKFDMPLVPPNFIGQTDLAINYSASAPINGLHLVFDVDKEKVRVGTPQTTDLTRNMTIASKYVNDKLHLVLCSMDGRALSVGNGAIINIPITMVKPQQEDEAIKLVHAIAGKSGTESLQTIVGNQTIETASVPETFALYQNTPNPFNMSTMIMYDIPNTVKDAVEVKLSIYNIQGQLVRTLEDRVRTAGKYTVHWNGTDESGLQVSSGVYYYKLIANDVVLTKKLAIMK